MAKIFDFIEHVDFRSIFPKLVDYDIRFYMYELLKVKYNNNNNNNNNNKNINIILKIIIRHLIIVIQEV